MEKLQELKELVGNLKKSPVFNMSLSSKELFHSNFLAWVIENYPDLFLKKLAEFVDLPNEDFKEVLREKENIDLTIKLTITTIFIENKVKSAPNKEQLEGYINEKKEGIFILLSLIKPAFDIKSIGWNSLDYENIAEILKYITHEISNKYHIEIITDYISVIVNLGIIANTLNFNANTVFNFYDKELELFKEIRLHDFYIKHCINQLSIKVYDELRNKLKDNNKITIGKWFDKNKHSIGSIIVLVNYSNGKGILHIEHVTNEDTLIGIMIDGQRYLYYITDFKGTTINQAKRVEYANNLKNSNQWFNNNSKLDNANTIRKENEYNKFGDKMLYKAALIPKTMEISTLIDVIVEDIQKASLIKIES